MQKILIVEDDTNINHMIKEIFLSAMALFAYLKFLGNQKIENGRCQ